MRPARSRFTVRRLMLLVAVSSLVCGAIAGASRLIKLRTAYLGRSAMHARSARTISADGVRLVKQIIATRDRLRSGRPHPAGPMDYLSPGELRGDDRPLLKVLERQEMMNLSRYEWHRRLELKYAEAARHPWLPVRPDPPEPR